MDEKITWSIGFVLVVVMLCVFKPNAGRLFLGFFYLLMAVGVNGINAFSNPMSTVQMGAGSLIPIYRTFFLKIVSAAPSFFILIVAVFQVIIAMMILNKHKKVKLGLLGATIFLILITPFGVIQLPWLGIAAIQIHLMQKDFDRSFLDMIFRRSGAMTKG